MNLVPNDGEQMPVGSGSIIPRIKDPGDAPPPPPTFPTR